MDTNTVIISGALALVVSLATKYLGKYSETKGSNQATKEDIGKLTEIVEGIKHDLAKQAETLKASLSIKSQHRLNLKKLQTDSILKYNELLSGHFFSMLNLKLVSYEAMEPGQLRQKADMVFQQMKEVTKQRATLVLVLDDREFEVINDLLIEEISLFRSLLVEQIFQLERVIGDFDEIFKSQPFSYANLAFFVSEQNIVVENYKEQQDIRMKSLQEIHKRYCKELYRILSTIDSSIDE